MSYDRWGRLAFVSLACGFFCALGACKEKQQPAPRRAAAKPRLPGVAISKRLRAGYVLHPVARTLPSDPKIAAYIKPFRLRLEKTMDQVLTRTPKALERRKPESVIGNLVADIAKAHLRRIKKPVDVFITNLGGIRNDLAAGPITIRAVYEALPFENVLVRAQVTGEKLLAIVHMLAKRGGEPVSGLRFQIKKGSLKPLRIRVRRRRIKAKKLYWIGTSDYVARTGFLKPFLKGIALDKTELLLRNSVILGLRGKRSWRRVRRDGRIKYRK